jgi:hypothetical protein
MRVSLPSKAYQGSLDTSKNGFILLEALVAMSLIVGAWMTLIQSYQKLSLKLMQQEQKRVKLTEEWNASELGFIGKAVNNESSRMPSGSRALHATTQPTSQHKR